MGSCKKTTYANQKLANEDIERIQAKSTRDKKPMRAYQCNQCNLWHLTSTPDYKALYLEQLAENKKLRSTGIVKSYELKIFKLQTKLKEKEAEYNKERSQQFNSNEEIKKLQATITKKGKELSRLQKDNADLINKIIQLEVKWHTRDEFPELDKDIKLPRSVDVLTHCNSLQTRGLAFYDFDQKKWRFYSPFMEMEDFIWTNLTIPKK